MVNTLSKYPALVYPCVNQEEARYKQLAEVCAEHDKLKAAVEIKDRVLSDMRTGLAEIRDLTGAQFGQDIRLVLRCLLETRENWRTTMIGLLEPWHGQHIDSRTRERIEKALGGYRHTSGIRKE